MIDDIRTAMVRARRSLWRDAVGMAAIGLAFYAVLHAPSFLSAV